MKFQIRDKDFGLAIYNADAGEEALADFLSDRMRGDVLAHFETAEDGSVSFVLYGRRYTAVPVTA